MTNKEIQRIADNIRVLTIAMTEKAQSGHCGGSMGGADFLATLYGNFLNFNPLNPTWESRDRFFLDAGHLSPMLYAIHRIYNIYTEEDIKNFRQLKSSTPGHPEYDLDHMIENSSGPLGLGHTMAVGTAISERMMNSKHKDWISHKTITYITDGGIQEEVSQGAGRLAGHLGLNNLIMFYDYNNIQLSTKVTDVSSEDTALKYKSWGWQVYQIDGHNIDEINDVLEKAYVNETSKPVLIIGKTIIGKGCLDKLGNKFENTCALHGQPLSKAGGSPEKTILSLGGDLKNPFSIFSDVVDIIKSDIVLTTKYIKSITYETNAKNIYNLNSIKHQPNISTRTSSGNILNYLSKNFNNILVSSSDMCSTDYTCKFLENTSEVKKDNFNGRFLQVGVSELTMAAIMNGVALHKYFMPICGTYFVFSDYMKPAIRLAAMMELPIKYIFTHDDFRVGEDGPTHQPIEHEAQLRLLEKIKNKSGNNSILVLRPADSEETTSAWKMALENKISPSVLILTRQNVKDIPKITNQNIERGAYIVDQSLNPDLILVANGSDVNLAMSVKEKLKTININANVISVISEGLFKSQCNTYKEAILPKKLLKLGITSGLYSNFNEIIQTNGETFGMKSFGLSAPYVVLEKEFGYTVENIVNHILTLLKRD